uniref:Uncharacterized protein LOC100182468 n=1 Tax=Phallusia mammillata TaxID=59560 RepID=A0A6F9DGZ2_9ASCI|nr:uncharacterized protein LOC100182468 [Phallusia mammillata]
MEGTHSPSQDFVDSSEESYPNVAGDKKKRKEFWNRKGVIKMDPNNNERCSHTIIPPSAMMTLAMELQVSNRGKASKMFKKAKSNARVASPDNETDEQEKSKLPELWVVPDAHMKSSSEEPTTASHLQPALDHSDFVFRPGFDSPTPQGRPVSRAGEAVDLNCDEIEFLESIDVSDLVGSKDNVIVYPDSDEEVTKSEKQKQKRSKCNKGNMSISSQDINSTVNKDNEGNVERPHVGSSRCETLTTTNDSMYRDYKSNAKGSAYLNDKVIKFNCASSKEQNLNVNAATNKLSQTPIISQDEVKEQRLCESIEYGGDKSIVTSSLHDALHRHAPTVSPLKGRAQEKLVSNRVSSPRPASAARDCDSDGQSGRASRDRAHSLSNKKKFILDEKRAITPEYLRALSQNDTASASSLSSSSLSSSLFSLSSLGSVSSASLHFSSVNGASEKTSVVSCASITPDSVDLHDRRRVSVKGREQQQIGVKPKHNTQSFVELVNTPSQCSVVANRQESRNVAMQSTDKYNPLSCSLACPSLNQYRNVDDDTNSRGSHRVQTNKSPQQQTLVTSRASSRVRQRSSESCGGSVSPSRKVICEYVDQAAPDLPDQQPHIKGRVVSKAVFPDTSDPTLVRPVLHLRKEVPPCQYCRGIRSEMVYCCCCGPKPTAPPRSNSRGATEKFRGVGQTPSPIPAARRRTPSKTTEVSTPVQEKVEERLSEVVQATGVQQSSSSPAAEPRSHESPGKDNRIRTTGNKNNTTSTTTLSAPDAAPVSSSHRIEGCRITLSSSNRQPATQPRVLMKNTLVSDTMGNKRVDGGSKTSSGSYVEEKSLLQSIIEHPRVNIVNGSKITLLKADSDLNCATSSTAKSTNKAQFGANMQPHNPSKNINKPNDKLGTGQDGANDLIVPVASATQESGVNDKTPDLQVRGDKNDGRVKKDRMQDHVYEASVTPQMVNGARKEHTCGTQKPVEYNSDSGGKPDHNVIQERGTEEMYGQGYQQGVGAKKLERIVTEPRVVKFEERKLRAGKSPVRATVSLNHAAGGGRTGRNVQSNEEVYCRNSVKRSQSMGSSSSAAATKEPAVFSNSVTLRLKSPTGKKHQVTRFVSPTPPKVKATRVSLSSEHPDGSKPNATTTTPEYSPKGGTNTQSRPDYKKWQGQSNNFQEVSVTPTVISRHRQVQDHERVNVPQSPQGDGHRDNTKVVLRPAPPTRTHETQRQKYENVAHSKRTNGLRMDNGSNRMTTRMVGNDEDKQEKVMLAPPHSATDDEDFSGVIEPPPIKVKDIRAMFKRGPDYQDYAKPRSLSSSNTPARRDSTNHPAGMSSNQSEADVCDDITAPDTQVAKQVMNLFKGALEMEKDSEVFEEETLRKQQELTNDFTAVHQSSAKQNGQMTTDINTNYVITKTPPETLPKPNKLTTSSWPPKSNPDDSPASPSDIKTSIAQIKSESEAVISFDESLDKFYDVLNDLTS